jgi:glycine/D-amino acid oxidase-like deaminating enzyme
MDSAKSPGYPSLRDEIKVDVAIVGAGIVGLTTAYLLKEAGLTVAVIEKDVVGGGVSGHTTGKVTSQHNLIYNKLSKRLGKNIAYAYGQANQAAITKIKEIVEREKIKFTDQASFHIRKYLLGLASVVEGDGSFVYEHSVVVGVHEGVTCKVRTSKGRVLANDIIVATNVPTFPLLARGTYCIAEYPKQSYIVAGRLKEDFDGMYISPDKDNYSILPVNDGQERLLLIGGEGHIPGTRLNTDTRYQRLANYAEKNFGITSIKYKWSDRDYLGYDDMPLIGKLYPWSEHTYTATGFMKWGLTNGTMASLILNDMVRGKANPLSAIFTPHRLSTVSSIPKVIGENLGVV